MARCGARNDCRLWQNQSGIGRGLSNDGIIRFGLRGSADILGIFSGGYLVAIEVKTGAGRQSKAQRAFEQMITRFGGHYAVVSNDVQAQVFLDHLRVKLLYGRDADLQF